MRNTLPLILAVVIGAALPTTPAGGADKAATQPKPLRVLILTGKNNHNWKATTPVLKKMYADSKRFTVDVTLDPSQCDAKTFAKYDAVVSNWTNWPHIKKREWGEKTEKAFLDFIRGGKGFVVIHAASTPFATWPEYRELVGSWWQLGQTGHGPVRKITVTVEDAEHPVTRGMKEFVTTDELWQRVGKQGKLNVLCAAKSRAGKSEPVVHVRPFGKGRCFHMTLGHDARAVRNVGFQTLMLRGTEWAATGKVTIAIPADWPRTADPSEKLRKYEAGESRLACTQVAEIVRQAAADPARRADVAAKRRPDRQGRQRHRTKGQP